ncbi:MAG: ABC transporter ATP-binding protein [Gemmatimonas sp.]
MAVPLVCATGLGRAFDGGEVQALTHASLTVNEGEFVSLMGPSGCGKSTLLQLIGALDRPDAGELRWRGQAYAALPDLAGFRSRRLGFVFQSFHLLPTLTALDNVQLPMFEREWSRTERRERAQGLLDAVGVAHRQDKRPAQLSGGERQRVAIARALANEPDLLLADEPTGSLDSASASQVLALLRALHEKNALTLLVVTHDAAVARQAERTVTMKDGRIVSDSALPT